jgi:hypothetical protein
MHHVALLIALGTTGGLFGGRHQAQPACAGGSCASPAYVYRSAQPSCAGGTCATAAPAVRPYAAPAYTYQPAAPAPAMVQAAPAPARAPVYQTAQARGFSYSRYYVPSTASCPNGTCPYTR